jgi:pyrroline-5-carboxylate reductase
MGVAVISGVISSLQSKQKTYAVPKWESHTPGTCTPTADSPDPSLPSFFIATVTRPESAQKLKHTFELLGGLGNSVKVLVGENIAAAQQADVVILSCVLSLHHQF